MKEIVCKKCNLVVLGSENICKMCGSKGVECLKLQITDNKILEKYINKGYEIVSKKLFIEIFGEEDVYGF